MPKDNTSVVVTGLGALTPVGNDVPTTWRALVEGRSGIKRITMARSETPRHPL